MAVSTVGVAGLVLLAMMFLRAPVFIAILSASVVYFIMSPSIPPLLIAQRVASGIESGPLLAVPFFICSGIFMNHSGVTRRIMDFCGVVTRRLPGGLGQVNVLLSTIMGGLSGSSMADAAMEAKILVPQMERKGYSKEFSTVVTATSSMITPLIPPGIGMIVYGSMAGVSIGKLFIAGIGPGLLLCFTMMLLVGMISVRRGYEVNPPRAPGGIGFGTALWRAALPLCMPVVIIGGIRFGLFTPTESGAIAIFYALGLGLLYRELRLDNFLAGLKETAITTGSVMIIVGTASAFGWILTREKIPQFLSGFMLDLTVNPFIFMLLVNILLLIVGMFIEGNAITIILAPLLAPIAAKYGINEIQFAMAFIFNVAIGGLTPPMGVTMFITCGITGCKIHRFIREAVPFYGLSLFCLLVLSYVPAVTAGVVNLLWRD
ncbi:MAG: TRAP transporter large permease [Planctomycetota bacterium]|jgi:tripartite ATP-independent transporter DctM subunit|nr:TRAP transporter large permease [Planctomycetota bacterium]